MNRQTVQNVRDVQRRVARLESMSRHNTLADTVAAFLAIPGLVAFWPTSVVRNDSPTDRVRDISGSGYHLTATNTPLHSYITDDGLAPYIRFNGTNQYLTRADGGAADWADIIGNESHISSTRRGLTLGGWFQFDSAAGSAETLMAKWLAAGNQRSYQLARDAAGNAAFYVSSSGAAATTTATLTDALDDAAAWYFVVGKWEPSTESTIFVNGASNTAVSADATLLDSTADFTVAVTDSLSGYMDGIASMCFLSAMNLRDELITSLYQQTRPLFVV
jgi:hypothetical protein